MSVTDADAVGERVADAKSEGRVGLDLRVEAHLEEIYGVKVGRDPISKVTDAVIDDARAWAQRPLEDVYPVIFLDAMVLNVREGGSVQRRACYLALGITRDGDRDVLGLWFQETGQRRDARGPQRGYGLSPLAAPHHRREELVFRGPSVRGKRSWPSPDGGRGKRSLTYERTCAPRAARGGSSGVGFGRGCRC